MCLDEGRQWSSHKGRMMMGLREVNVCAPALQASTENGGNPSEAPCTSHKMRYFLTKDSIDPSCLKRKTSRVKPRSDVDNSPKRDRDVFVKSLVEVGAAVEQTNVVRRWVEEMNSEGD